MHKVKKRDSYEQHNPHQPFKEADHKTENLVACSESCQISEEKRFAKIFKSKKPLTIIAKCYILDV